MQKAIREYINIELGKKKDLFEIEREINKVKKSELKTARKKQRMELRNWKKAKKQNLLYVRMLF